MRKSVRCMLSFYSTINTSWQGWVRAFLSLFAYFIKSRRASRYRAIQTSYCLVFDDLSADLFLSPFTFSKFLQFFYLAFIFRYFLAVRAIAHPFWLLAIRAIARKRASANLTSFWQNNRFFIIFIFNWGFFVTKIFQSLLFIVQCKFS